MSTEENQKGNIVATDLPIKSLTDKKIVPEEIANVTDGKNKLMQENTASPSPFIPEKQRQIFLNSNIQNNQNESEPAKTNKIPNISQNFPTANDKVSNNNERLNIPILQSSDTPKDRS